MNGVLGSSVVLPVVLVVLLVVWANQKTGGPRLPDVDGRQTLAWLGAGQPTPFEIGGLLPGLLFRRNVSRGCCEGRMCCYSPVPSTRTHKNSSKPCSVSWKTQTRPQMTTEFDSYSLHPMVVFNTVEQLGWQTDSSQTAPAKIKGGRAGKSGGIS